MKFGFKQKIVAAGVAIAASTGAHAAIQGTELAFFAANGTSNSVLFDLGLNMSQFGPGFANTIVWDFDANGGLGSVTATTPGSNSVDYGNIWNSPGFTFGAGTKWGVIGADAIAGDLVSTSADAAGVVGSTQNDPGFQASVDVPGVYFGAANTLGTHGAVANGADFATAGSALHANGFGIFDNWRANTPFSAALAGPGSMAFYRLAYDNAGGGTSPMLLSPYAGSFTFNAATAQLTYQAAVIPEPSTYALLAAGLLMFGAVARRRMAA